MKILIGHGYKMTDKSLVYVVTHIIQDYVHLESTSKVKKIIPLERLECWLKTGYGKKP